MNIDWAMQQEAMYKELTGHDGWNRPVYAPDVTLRLRWQFKQELIRAANGNEEMCDAQVWCPTTISPKADDRFEYQGRLYVVASAMLPVNLYGESEYWRLYLKAVAL
jgi:hypothetical protein